MFVGTANVWRTKTHGMGTMTLAEAQQHCNEWTGDFAVTCGDWAADRLDRRSTAAGWGDRAGGGRATAVERTTADTSTAWAATTTGRVFISKNVDADPAGAVTWTRLDSLAANDPNRFVSGIYVDPANPNRAWSRTPGFDVIDARRRRVTCSQVTYNPGAGTATWADLSHDLGDLPINDVVLDPATGDLYASSDFGVYCLAGRRGASPPRRRHDDLDELRAGPAGRRGREPGDRRGRADPVRGDPWPGHLEAEPGLTRS